MLDRFELKRISEESEEAMEVAGWVWNSHWWVEHTPGYCKCKWCGVEHTSEMPINRDFPLCRKNYAIKKLLAE